VLPLLRHGHGRRVRRTTVARFAPLALEKYLSPTPEGGNAEHREMPCRNRTPRHSQAPLTRATPQVSAFFTASPPGEPLQDGARLDTLAWLLRHCSSSLHGPLAQDWRSHHEPRAGSVLGVSTAYLAISTQGQKSGDDIERARTWPRTPRNAPALPACGPPIAHEQRAAGSEGIGPSTDQFSGVLHHLRRAAPDCFSPSGLLNQVVDALFSVVQRPGR